MKVHGWHLRGEKPEGGIVTLTEWGRESEDCGVLVEAEPKNE